MCTWRQSFTLLFQCWNHLICFQDRWYTFYRSNDAKYIFRWRRPLVKLPIRSEVETTVYTAHASLYINYMGPHIIITYICWSDARIILIMKQKFSDIKNNTLKRSKFFVSLPFCFCCSLNAGSKPTEVTVSLFILSIGNFEVRDMVGNYVYPSCRPL